jgi:NADPH-dependent glutamate synthase beta subunit-like oxidoreductase
MGHPESVCIVAEVLKRLKSAVASGEGLCGNCRLDLDQIAAVLSGITEGEGGSEALELLSELANDLLARGHCLSVREILRPLLSSLETSMLEYEAHVLSRNCPARYCQRLIPAPCQNACPAGIDIPGYLALTARGLYAEALSLIREDNPFPWVCGLICPHPCEKVCIRGKLDAPVNIRFLKAFVAENANGNLGLSAIHSHPDSQGQLNLKKNGKKVAVIGSGPAGLSCAHYLAHVGYAVTIFEALPHPGGLLVYGIPEYRLPRDIVRKEIEAIESLGVEIRTGVRIGKDLSVDELRGLGFDAFFFAIGAHEGLRLGIEGEAEFVPVYDAITFLREVNSGKKVKPGDRVVVIGGGNSAMDAARTCIRLGARGVHLAYRRTRAEMPANPQEVIEAIEEGVQMHFLTVPVRIRAENGRVSGLECLRAELGEPDASGRRRPCPVEGSNFQIEADAIIAAIGQEPDLRSFSDNIPFPISRRNRVLTREPNTQTETPDIFAGGDAVSGPATVVAAIGTGKQGALDIDHYLSGRAGSAPLFINRKRSREKPLLVPAEEKIAAARVPMRLAEIELRKANFEPVEASLSEDEARKEAGRCLRCDICIRCGACAKVCSEEMKIEALSFKEIGSNEQILSDYARPAERCIGCGACALACPTGAMEIFEAEGHRELRLCGTVLNRLDVMKCENCGESFVSERFLDFVTKNSDSRMGKPVPRELCVECARVVRAKDFV